MPEIEKIPVTNWSDLANAIVNMLTKAGAECDQPCGLITLGKTDNGILYLKIEVDVIKHVAF